MGNLGGGEILVIMLVALLVLGPSKLPEAARQVGKAVAEFRKVSGGFQRELRAALEAEPTPAAKVPSGLPEPATTDSATTDSATTDSATTDSATTDSATTDSATTDSATTDDTKPTP